MSDVSAVGRVFAARLEARVSGERMHAAIGEVEQRDHSAVGIRVVGIRTARQRDVPAVRCEREEIVGIRLRYNGHDCGETPRAIGQALGAAVSLTQPQVHGRRSRFRAIIVIAHDEARTVCTAGGVGRIGAREQQSPPIRKPLIADDICRRIRFGLQAACVDCKRIHLSGRVGCSTAEETDGLSSWNPAQCTEAIEVCRQRPSGAVASGDEKDTLRIRVICEVWFQDDRSDRLSIGRQRDGDEKDLLSEVR